MKRLAQKTRIQRPLHDLTGRGDGPIDPNWIEVWIPPSSGEIDDPNDLIESLGLPKPNLSTFQVGGFDIEVTGGFSFQPGQDAIRVMASMDVLLKGEDRWDKISIEENLLLPQDKEERARAWRSCVHRLITKLLEHELNETLLFDGKHYREPHPERIQMPPPKARDMAFKMSEMKQEIIDMLLNKSPDKDKK